MEELSGMNVKLIGKYIHFYDFIIGSIEGIL